LCWSADAFLKLLPNPIARELHNEVERMVKLSEGEIA
jgi:hypothetical protein